MQFWTRNESLCQCKDGGACECRPRRQQVGLVERVGERAAATRRGPHVVQYGPYFFSSKCDAREVASPTSGCFET